MFGDRHMGDASTVVLEDDEHEQQPEGHRRHDEQIGGHDLARVVGEEGPPGVRRRARMPFHECRDGRLTDRDSHLLQFAMDPRRTPERIRARELADQRAHVGGHARSAGAPAALPGPEEPKAASVPGDDGLRPDDVKSRPPAGPGSREPRPQHPVGRRQTETWAPRSMDNRELMSEREDFEVQRRAGPDQRPKRVEQRDDDGRHGSSLSKNSRNLNRRSAYGVSGRHRQLSKKMLEHTRTSGSRQRVRCSPGWKSDGRRRKAPETADNAHDLRRVLCRLARDDVRQVPGWTVAGCDTRAVSPELTFDTSGDWADIGSADCLSNDHSCRMAKKSARRCRCTGSRSASSSS